MRRSNASRLHPASVLGSVLSTGSYSPGNLPPGSAKIVAQSDETPYNKMMTGPTIGLYGVRHVSWDFQTIKDIDVGADGYYDFDDAGNAGGTAGLSLDYNSGVGLHLEITTGTDENDSVLLMSKRPVLTFDRNKDIWFNIEVSCPMDDPPEPYIFRAGLITEDWQAQTFPVAMTFTYGALDDGYSGWQGFTIGANTDQIYETDWLGRNFFQVKNEPIILVYHYDAESSSVAFFQQRTNGESFLINVRTIPDSFLDNMDGEDMHPTFVLLNDSDSGDEISVSVSYWKIIYEP